MYYYKQVEEAYARFYNAIKQINEYAGDEITSKFGIDFKELPEKIIWSSLDSVKDSHLSEDDLSDDKKEEIALFNKEKLDEAIQNADKLVDSLYPVLSRLELDDVFSNHFNQNYADALDYIIQVENNTSDSGDSSMYPFVLTNEELYYSLSFLTDEEVRGLLKGQNQKTFDALYSAIRQRDKNLFINTLKENELRPINTLRGLLIYKVGAIISFEDFILSSDNSRLFKVLASEMGFDDSSLDLLDIVCGENTGLNNIPEVNLNSMMSLKQTMVSMVFHMFENNDDIPTFYRRNLSKKYDEWKEGVSDQVDTEVPVDVFIESPLYKICIALMDRWLRHAIHIKMEEDIVEEVPVKTEQHLIRKCRQKGITQLGVSNVIMNECRMVGKDKETNIIYNEALAILYDFLTVNSREAIKLKRDGEEVAIGSSLECSLEDFQFLLGGKNVADDFESQPYLSWRNSTTAKEKSEFQALLYALYWNENPKMTDEQKRAGAPSRDPRKSLCLHEGYPIPKLSDNGRTVYPLIPAWVELLKECGKKAKGRYQRREI